jgi:hypothetical protein
VSADRDITAYVDGKLEGRALARFEARLAAEPELAAEVERQRAAVRVVSAAVAETVAPAGLRQRVEALQREADRGRRRRPRAWRPAFGAAIAAAAAVAVFAVVLGAGGPTLDEAAALARRPATAPALTDPAKPRLLRDQVDGVRFPNYAKKFGWEPVGKRQDEIDGRTVRTVFYEKDGERIAYSIVDGGELDYPDDEPATVDGVELYTFDNAVAWERGDHTCVLSGTDRSTLLTLAAWKAQGDVTF